MHAPVLPLKGELEGANAPQKPSLIVQISAYMSAFLTSMQHGE